MNTLEYNKLHSKLNVISTSEGISGTVVSIVNKILFGIKDIAISKTTNIKIKLCGDLT